MEVLRKIIAIHLVKSLIIGFLALIIGIISLALIAWGLENINISLELLAVLIIGSLWKEEIKAVVVKFF